MSKLKTALSFLRSIAIFGKKSEKEQASDTTEIPCCSEKVHIAYRGLSDDRLYIAHNRTWYEVRFYKPYGLRVFCAVCRRRVY